MKLTSYLSHWLLKATVTQNPERVYYNAYATLTHAFWYTWKLIFFDSFSRNEDFVGSVSNTMITPLCMNDAFSFNAKFIWQSTRVWRILHYLLQFLLFTAGNRMYTKMLFIKAFRVIFDFSRGLHELKLLIDFKEVNKLFSTWLSFIAKLSATIHSHISRAFSIISFFLQLNLKTSRKVVKILIIENFLALLIKKKSSL